LRAAIPTPTRPSHRVLATIADRGRHAHRRIRDRRISPEQARQRWEQHEDEDGDEILDDQPADRDAAIGRVDYATVLERPQQDYGTGNGEGESGDDARAPRPSPQVREERAEQSGYCNRNERSWHRKHANREEGGKGEVQADPEHQQYDADLSRLRRQPRVRREPRSERSRRNPGQQIAED